MSRHYVVHMPRAEALHLAGVEPASRSGGGRKPGPAGVPAGGRPVRGPFGPDRHGIVPPGHVEYLGAGTVRLDEAAISSLAGLGPDTDFRVIFADSGPVLLVGADRYPATEPDPATEP